METNIFLILVLLLIIILYFFYRYTYRRKERYFVKKDTPPITSDVEKVFEKSSNENFVKALDLKYYDKEGDKIEKVRFFNTKGRLFYDSKKTKVYIDGEELELSFKLYIDIKNIKELNIKYQVMSNNKWSK